MSSFVQSLVVGAGVVGLSAARLLAKAGREVLLVEKSSRVCLGVSSRNSGVVHAGLYYERGSLKASTCVEGSWMLHRFAQMYNVPLKKCGKLVVAMDKGEDAKLQIMYMRAIGLGARDIVLLDGEDTLRIEPSLKQSVAGAIWSPHTAVIDPVMYGEALLADSRGSNFTFSAKSEVVKIDYSTLDRLFTVEFADGERIRCQELVNAAGLYATQIAGCIKGLKVPQIRYKKGSYFALKAPSPFQRLVYPMRRAGRHLGIHTVIDPVSDSIKFGPDSVDLNISEMPDSSSLFTVDPMDAPKFRAAVERYWEDVPSVEHFVPDFAGIRPTSIHGDFVLDQHGIPGYVGLYGIDSPGLTASLSLAHRVGDLLGVTGITTPEMQPQ